jgi:hypothetical protein
VQGCRLPEASPLKTPGGASATSLAAAALRPSAHAALQGLSAERLPHGFETGLLQRQHPNSFRRSNRRKTPPERLPIGLMQHRSWLMRGCEGGASRGGEPIGSHAAIVATGDTDAPMSEAERALRHCLSLRARRWATFEFMTATLDEPWLQRGTMTELLEELGLGGVHATALFVMRSCCAGLLVLHCRSDC